MTPYAHAAAPLINRRSLLDVGMQMNMPLLSIISSSALPDSGFCPS